MRMALYTLSFQPVPHQYALWPQFTKDLIAASLTSQGCTGCDRERYRISVVIREGSPRPFKDIDNYAKKLADGITLARMLWHDDEQVDELTVKRTRMPGQVGTFVDVEIERLRSST
jgi:hypothetical protein